MTLAIGLWVVLAGGVMIPGGDDPLAISAPIRANDYSAAFALPASKKADGILPMRSAAGGDSTPSRYGGGAAASRYGGGARMGRTFGQGGYSRTSSTMPRMIMPLAPTDAGTTGFMPAPPTAALPSSPGMYGRRGGGGNRSWTDAECVFRARQDAGVALRLLVHRGRVSAGPVWQRIHPFGSQTRRLAATAVRPRSVLTTASTPPIPATAQSIPI